MVSGYASARATARTSSRRRVPPGAPPREGAILPSAPILKPGKITGKGAVRHT
jgi:hypothetical protein